jgi:hypothetical protein
MMHASHEITLLRDYIMMLEERALDGLCWRRQGLRSFLRVYSLRVEPETLQRLARSGRAVLRNSRWTGRSVFSG